LNSKTVNKIGIDADAILKKDIEFNNIGADKAATDAANNYSSAFMMVVAIIGIALAVGIAVGIYTVRDVSRGIASIVAPMQALGAGDLTAQVPHQARRPKSARWRIRCRCSRKR